MFFIYAVAECKKAWQSLKDSRRYNIKKKKFKSGSGLNEDTSIDMVSEEETDLSYAYADVMDFMPNTTYQRQTLSSTDINESTRATNASVELPTYNYVSSQQVRNIKL